MTMSFFDLTRRRIRSGNVCCLGPLVRPLSCAREITQKAHGFIHANHFSFCYVKYVKHDMKGGDKNGKMVVAMDPNRDP